MVEKITPENLKRTSVLDLLHVHMVDPNRIVVSILITLFVGLMVNTMNAQSLPTGKTGDPARFGIDGDIEADNIRRPTIPIDDWFSFSANNNNGFPVILDPPTTRNFYKTQIQNSVNISFELDPAFDQYEVQNNSILYDAVYARDFVSASDKDKTTFLSSAKNGEDPNNWEIGTGSLTSTYDLVDIYAHVRREGTVIGGDMWLFLGASIMDPAGVHYVDFEVYKKEIRINNGQVESDGTEFGHSAWDIDPVTGNINDNGDLLINFGFSGASHTLLEVGLWVEQSKWENYPKWKWKAGAWVPVDVLASAGWTGPKFIENGYLEATNGNTFGYGTIIIESDGYFAQAIQDGDTERAPFWGTTTKDGYSTAYNSGGLMEIGVNLSNLRIDPGTLGENPCDAPYVSIIAKTRTGSDFGSQLKDIVGPYDFLKTPVVSSTIEPHGDLGSCTNDKLELRVKDPVAGGYYIWTTNDGEFANGMQTSSGPVVEIIKPGTYSLNATAFPGCFAEESSTTVFAKPCAVNDDMGVVTENNGQGNSVTYNIIQNDSDLDNDLDYSSVILIGLSGYATVNYDSSTGTIYYQPNDEEFGRDTFTYQICDSRGICDTAEVTIFVQRDSDADGIPDIDDLDDDNDGIPDLDESNGIDPSADPDNDDIPNFRDPEFCTLNSYGICANLDLDNDGIPNHLDLDSDGDGCSDAIESTATINKTTEYQFPASPVGADGIPDAVQNTDNSLNYSISDQFLDASKKDMCEADLEIKKEVDNDKPDMGSKVVYTITLTNKGPGLAAGVKVLDLLPSGLTYDASTSTIPANTTYNSSTGIWDLSAMPYLGKDQEVILRLGAIVGTTVCSDIINTASVNTADVFDPDSSNNSASITITPQDVIAPTPDAASLSDITAQCEVTTLTPPTATDNCGGTVTVTKDTNLPIDTQGTTIVTWTFEDEKGNTSTQTQNIVIADTTAPTPDVANLSDVTAQCQVTSLTIPAATDNCGGPVMVSHDATLPINSQGTTIVTWTFTDAQNNIFTQTQNVVINDTTAPTIPTLDDVTGECSATVTAPTTTDNCSGTITATTTDSLTYSTQGTHTITWTFDDGNGQSITVDQNVIINDTTAPVIPTLADVTGECTASAVTPTTTDFCSGTITGTTTDPLTYTTQGTHVITWTFDDGNGQSITVDQNVIINDTTAPTTPTLADVTGECTASVVAPTTTDNCSGTITGTTTDPLTYSTQGTHKITWTFDDGNGQSITVDQNVIINDTTAPTPDLATLSDIIAQCEVVSLTDPSATDNCGGAVSVSHNATLPITAQGTTVVTWTYEDAQGNKSTQTQNVIITDTTAPTPDVATLSDITAQCEVVSLTDPTATDNCGGSVSVSHNATLPITAQGTTVVTWTYEDAQGNKSTQTQNVVITDTTAPTPDVATLSDITAQCEVVSLTDPSATDNCGGTVSVSHNASLPITAQGTTVVTWTYEDAQGNKSTQTQNVVITDTTAPTPDVATLSDITAQCEVVALTDPTATDNCGGSVSVSHNATLPITTQGTTVVTWTYEDAQGNKSTQTQNVVITDTTAPNPDVATLSDITAQCEVVSLPDPSATDNCGGTVSVSHNATLPITAQGTTVVTWTYEDAQGNKSTQTQNVVITDTTAPTITCPTGLTDIQVDNGQCYATISLDNPVVDDNCGSVTVTNNAPATFPVGTTTVIWTVTDAAGNSTNCNQTITVISAPVAVNDSASTQEEKPVSFGVISNDTDCDNNINTNSITTTSGVNNGSLTFNTTTKQFTYTPDAEFFGTDQFTYTITDLDNQISNTATVTITVIPVNDPPKAVDDSNTTPEDTALNISATNGLISNDSDNDNVQTDLTITNFTINNVSYNAGETAAITDEGNLQINADGSYIFTPAQDFNGTVSKIRYTLSDGNLTDNGNLSLEVTPVNDAPNAVADNANTHYNQDITINVLSNDYDVDGDAIEIISVTQSTKGQGNTLAGSVTWNPGETTITFTPPAGTDTNGNYFFQYTIQDTSGLTSVATVKVSIPFQELAPEANPDSYTIPEDLTLSLNATDGVLKNDYDGNGDVIEVVSASIDLNGNGTDDNLPLGSPTNINDISGNLIGSLTLTRLGELTFIPATNYNGTLPLLNYVIEDTTQKSDFTTVTIKVTPVNDSPIATNDNFNGPEDAVITGNVITIDNDNGVDSDPENDPLEVTKFIIAGDLTEYPTGQTASISNVGNFRLNANGDLSFTPVQNYNGKVPDITYTLSDDNLTSDAIISIRINLENDAPVAENDILTLNEGALKTVNVVTNDYDVDGSLDLTTVEITTAPANGSVSLNNDGTIEYTHDGSETTSDLFKYTIKDNEGAISNIATVQITINPVNDPATFGGIDTGEVTEDESTPTLTETATLTISDNDNSNTFQQGSATTSNDALGSLSILADGTWTYTVPNADVQYLGTGDTKLETFTVSSFDGTTHDIEITIIGVNDAPIADNSVINVDEESNDTPLGLLGPTDVEGDALSITVTTLPSLGTVTLANGNAVVVGQSLSSTELTNLLYNAPADYTPGNDAGEFGYSVADAHDTVFGTTDITINPVNDAPLANDDSLSLKEGATKTVDVATNDTDEDGTINISSIVITTAPVYGTLTVNTNGTVDYEHDGSETTTDSFKYTIKDNNGAVSNIATVQITIDAVNDPATFAGTDTGEVTEDESTPNLTETATLTVSDNDNLNTFQAGTATASAGALGSLSILEDGIWTYTIPNDDVQYLGTGDTKVETFTVSSIDGTTHNIEITIIGVNDAPIVDSSAITVDEDSNDTPLGLLGPTDVEGDVLTITVTTLPILGTVTLANGNAVSPGQILTTTELTNLLYDAPSDYTPGTDAGEFKYSVADDHDTTLGATDITINPVNDAPVAANDEYTILEDADATSLDVLKNDSDIDGDVIFVSAVGTAPNGTVNLSNGIVTYKPNADFTGTDTFTYTISDGNGGSSTATVTVNVTPVNDPPVAVNDSAETDEEVPVTISVLSNDSDIDSSILTVSGTTNPANGKIAVNSDGTITYTPNLDFTGIDTFNYRITDGSLVSNFARVTIDVGNTNDAPLAVNDKYTIAEDADATTLDVLINDSDVDGDAISVASVGTATNGTVNLTGGVVTYEPNADFTGKDTFTYTISDGNGGTDSATVTIDVTPVNDPPVANDDNYIIAEDADATTLNVLANDSDIDGDAISVASVGTATNGTVNLTGGVVTYEPNADFTGKDTFTYTISDGNGGTDSATVTIDVTPVNDPPVANDDNYTIVEDADATTLNVLANDSDVDGDAISVASVGTATNGTVNLTSGVVTYEPNDDFTGKDTFTYTISDGNGGTNSATVTIDVTPVNDPPVAVDDYDTSISPTTPYSTERGVGITIQTIGFNDSDVDGNVEPSTIVLIDPNDNSNTGNSSTPLVISGVGTYTVNSDGDVSFTSVTQYEGPANVIYTIQDNVGQVSNTATVFIQVLEDPAMTLVKDGTFNDTNNDGNADAGETISYTFTVTNTGNVTLTNISVTDPKVTVSGGPISLAPGASDNSTFTATYTITQADVDAGEVVNTAVANSDETTDPVNSNEEKTPLSKEAKLTITNVVDLTAIDEPSTLTYTISVANTGNVSLTGLSLTDDTTTATLTSGDTNNDGILDVNEIWVFEATYNATQTDINNGTTLSNTATVVTNQVPGPTSATASTTIDQNPAMTLVKDGTFNDTNNDGNADAGETISYTFTVTNTGNVTLNNIAVTDPKVTVSGGPVSLAPGASDNSTFTATYTITQADVDAGEVVNTAVANSDETTGPVNSNEEKTPLSKEAKLTITNVVDLTAIDEPSPLTYTISVANTGNVSLTGLTLTDDTTTATLKSGDDGNGVLDVNEIWVFEATYNATQTDINNGTTLSNTASVVTNEVPGPTSATANTTIDQNPIMTLVKDGTFNDTNSDGNADAGETISYTFTVTNTGNVTLNNIKVTDPKVTVSGGPISLAPGVSDNSTFTATYTITQADVDAGEVINTAVANSDETTGPVNSNEENTPLSKEAKLTITNVVDLTAIDEPSTLTYTISVANTGNVSLTGLTLTDDTTTATLESGDTNNDGVLDVNEVWVFEATYNATQNDIDAGTTLSNTASVVTNEVPGPTSATANTTIDQNPIMTLVKDGTFNDTNSDGNADAGETISYTFTVTNTGNVTLTNIEVTDPKVTVSGAPISLAPGASDNTTFTAEYILTQDDINAGEVVNTAVVTSDETIDPVNSNEETTDIDQSPNMELAKSGSYQDNGDGIVNAGDKIIYTFTVTNTGNVTLTNIEVTDPKVTVSGAPISLAPGASDNTTFTAEYILTQDDINAGEVVNTAVVTSDETTDPVNSNEETTDIDQSPNMELAKSGSYQDNGDGIVNAGDKIIYTFTVTNTGNVTLTNIEVTDPKVTVSGAPISLAPGASDNTTFTAEYILTQDDINAGEVVNTAVVTSDETTDPVNSNEETTNIDQSPNMELAKSGSYQDNGDGIVNAGDKIIYTFTVTNTGNVTLTNIEVTDPKVTVSGAPISLAPGASDNTTFTAEYILTQDDINAGEVVNTAVVTSDETTDPVNSNEETTNIDQSPNMELVKSGSYQDNGDGIVNAGDKIIYTFTVTNTGNVTLTNIEVTDPKVTVSGDPIDLAPGASDNTTFTAEYILTQDDINAGEVVNTAVVTSDETTDPVNSNEETTDIDQSPNMELAKSGSYQDNGDGIVNAGDKIIYTFTVTNTGNVTLTNIEVTDPKVTVSGAPISLAPGASDNTTFTAEYILTQDDINAGEVVNTAVVTSDETTDPVNSNEETTNIDQSPNIELAKSGSYQDNGDGIVNAGDKIIYTFTVTNTGNVTLTNIEVTDPKVTVSGAPISLAPGASDNTTFTAEYILTQDDINAGEVVNTAVVTSDETTDPVNSNEETTDIDQSPNMELAKSGSYQDNGDGIVNAGDKIIYTFIVTNTGNVTLTNIQVTDPKVTVSGDPISLAPGASDDTTFTAEYILTQDDINAGEVVNTAVVTSDETTDPVNSNEETTDIDQSPNMELAKSGSYQDNGDGIVNAGDKIIYTFTVTNTGNVTLTNIEVTDPKVTVSGDPIDLAPGASDNTTFTAEYILTQDDINAGEVVNTAVVTSDETTDPVNSNEETTDIDQSPNMELAKSGSYQDNGDGIVNAGDKIIYTFTVTNTGNVTLTNIKVTDPKVTVSGGPISLAPGTSDDTTFTAEYILTQDDINAGEVVNTAVVTSDETTDPVNSNEETTDIDQSPAIEAIKTVRVAGSTIGDVIEYDIVVTNTGNVTIDNIEITDDNADTGSIQGSPILTLAPGDYVIVTAKQTITQDHIDAGFASNSATATGDSPSGTDDVSDVSDNGDPSDGDDNPTITDLDQDTQFAITKSTTTSNFKEVGDVIKYKLEVTNNGNTTIDNVVVTDLNADNVTYLSGDANLDGLLNVDETWTYKADHTVTSSDFSQGYVENTAEVDAKDPAGTVINAISNTVRTGVLMVQSDEGSVNEDTSYTIDVLANDSYDPAATPKVTSVTDPSNGSVVINSNGTITYTPNPDFNGVDSFEYVITVDNADGTTSEEINTMTVTILPVEDAVVDNATTSEDEEVVIDVLDNDTYDPATDVEVTSVTQPDNGTVVINPDGTVTYTPNPDYNGTDTFEYTATVTNADGSTTTETTTVTVNVEGTADAVADNATTSEDEEVIIDVLDNDTYDPATDVEVTSVTQPDNGTVVINPDGTVTYTPNPDYNGTDTFEYTATVTNADGSTTTETTTVTVNVEGTADAVADNATTSEDEEVVIDVLDNDTYDPATDVEVTSVTQPDNGTVVINPDGTVTYTPNPDYNGTDTFEYTATVTNADGSTTTETTTVTVNVEGTPDAVADNATTSEDEAVVIDVLDNDTYDPATDVEVTSVTQPDNGTVVINPDGTVTYTPNPDYNGTDTFEYTATVTNADGSTTTETTTVNVNVEGAPDAVKDSATTSEDEEVVIDVLDNDTYDPATDVEVTSVTQPDNGTVVINPDGTVTYTPNPDYNGTDTFEYTATVTNADGSTTTETTTVTVNVEGTADAVADNATTSEDEAVVIDVLDNDTYDPATDVEVTSVTQPDNGTVVINPDGTVTYTPNPDYNGTDTFEYTATVTNADGSTTTETTTVTVNVEGTTDAVADNATTSEDEAVVIDVLDNDTYDPATDVEVTSVTQPDNGTVVINPDGTVTYTPNPDYNGTDTFEYTATVTNADGSTTTETTTVTVNVEGTPDAVADNATTSEDEEVVIDVLDNDTYDPATDVEVTSVTQPDNGTVVINPDGTVTYTPNPDYNGTDTFEYTATVTNADGSTTTETTTVTVNVEGTPDAVADNATTSEDEEVVIDVLDNDTYDPATDVEVTSVTQPDNGTVVINPDGTVTYTPNPDYNGTDTFEYTATVTNADGSTTTETTTVTVNVEGTTDAVADNATTSEDEEVVIDVLDNDTYDPATDVEVTSVTQPDNGTVVINPDGTVTYTPNPDYNGTDTFEYTATVSNADGSTTTETTTVTVNVEGTADAMDDYATTLENTSVTVEVLENDTFNENTNVEITGVTTPANGTATINPDGTITYIPGSEFYGNDQFEYTVTVTNANGSTTTESATVFITVDKQPDGPQITVTQPDCSIPTGSIVIDPIDGYTYSFNGGNFETTSTFEQLAPGIYTIVAMDSKGYKSDPVSIEILTQPDTPEAPVVLEIYEASCDLPTASIIIEIEDGISYYLKNEAGEVIVNSENDGIFEDLVPGEYMIYAESDNGCISSPTSLVIEEPQAAEIETEPLELCIGDDPEDLFKLFPEGIDKSGTWVDPANTGALNDEFLDPKFLEVGTYTFTYVLEGNCPSETNVTVTINDLCEVLNCELSDIKASISKVVTPNGDNHNDYFMVDQDVKCDLTYDVMIFNRWGAKVFEAENYQNNWDGQSQESVTRSNQLPAGTYYYIVKMRDSDFKPIQGYIYLGTK